MENKLLESIVEQLEEVREDICDNYCKYRETSDENLVCDAIRENGFCTLDLLP